MHSNFAAEKHAAQKRKGAAAEPYISHLIEVSYLASTVEEPDPNLIIAALLRDVIEDCRASRGELAERFSPDMADLLMEMTDDKSLPRTQRKRLQVVTAPKKSPRAHALKLADKISNLRAVLNSAPTDWSLERRREYFEWARQVVDNLSIPNPVLKAQFEQAVRPLIK